VASIDLRSGFVIGLDDENDYAIPYLNAGCATGLLATRANYNVVIQEAGKYYIATGREMSLANFRWKMFNWDYEVPEHCDDNDYESSQTLRATREVTLPLTVPVALPLKFETFDIPE